MFAVILGSVVGIYANSLSEDKQNVLSKEELQEKIDYLNYKYPDAELRIEDFLAVDVLLSEMTQAELGDFIYSILQSKPEGEYFHEDEYGVDSTLLVMIPGVIYECGRVLGTTTYYSVEYVSYDNTTVFLSSDIKTLPEV